MKAESEGRRQNEECRSVEKLGSGIRSQPLGCRGLRQLWRTGERRQTLESELTVRREPRRAGFEFRRPRQTVYGGWLSNLVEREGVIKFLTVRNLVSPGAGGGCRKASVQAAAFSHLCHIEPSRGWVGYRRGEETAPCMGCLRRLPPEGGVPGSREETAPCLAVRAREAGCRQDRLGLSRPLRRCAGLRLKPLDQSWRGRNSIWVEGVGGEDVLNG